MRLMTENSGMVVASNRVMEPFDLDKSNCKEHAPLQAKTVGPLFVTWSIVVLLVSLSSSCANSDVLSYCAQIALNSIHSRTGKTAPIDPSLSLVSATKIRLRLGSYFSQNIRKSKFDVTRGVDDYFLHFSLSDFDWSTNDYVHVDSLITTLARLGSSSHVIDLGAGTFQFLYSMATRPTEVLSEFERKRGPHRWGNINSLLRANSEKGIPNFTGISVTDLSQRYFRPYEKTEVRVPDPYELTSHSKINALIGRYFEEIPMDQIISRFGKADVVIDLYGVLTYTMNLGWSIEKVANLMKTDGDLWLVMDRSTIKMGKKIFSLSEFLVELGLFRIVNTNSTRNVVHLRRTAQSAQKIHLFLHAFEAPGTLGGAPDVEWVLFPK